VASFAAGSAGSSGSWSRFAARADSRLRARGCPPPPARARAAQPLDLVVKRLDVLELAIHGGEAHIGNLVQVAQLLHHQLADRARDTSRSPRLRTLCTTRLSASSISARGTGRFCSAFSSRRAASPHRTPRAPDRLDHHRHEKLGGFEGRETLATLQALAAAADLPALAGEARVGHLGLNVAQKGQYMRLGSAPTLRPVDREAPAQLDHLGRTRSITAGAASASSTGDEIRHLLHLGHHEAASGARGRADAQTARNHRGRGSFGTAFLFTVI